MTLNRHLIIATAGHIDHGKTSLVRALTGMETDRLAEEQRRGITIELGFAFLGDRITIIDVPGHERFIKTMVAGVSTVDLGLFVVAADDGVMPQSREHVAILGLLGIPHLFVTITKTAGLSTEWVDLVEEEVRSILPHRYRESAQFFRCDSISGDGIEELKSAILTFADSLPPRTDSGVFRLPVDRVFSMKGYGTVVTGTILGGNARAGDKLLLMPQKKEVRMRGMQRHGVNRPELRVGDRAALNILGADVTEVHRGDWICEKGIFQATDLLDVEIQTLPETPQLKNRDRIRLHLGTAEVIGRILLLGGDVAEAGNTAFAQLVLEAKVLAVRGDRFILRRYSPLETLGGGRVLDPLPERKRRRDSAALEAMRALSEVEGSEALLQRVRLAEIAGFSQLKVLTFLGVTPLQLEEMIGKLKREGMVLQMGSGENSLLITVASFTAIKVQILEKINDYHTRFPQLLGIKLTGLTTELPAKIPVELIEEAVNELLQSNLLLEKGFLRCRDHVIQLDAQTDERCDKIMTILTDSGFSPPNLGELGKALKLTEPELNRILSIMTQQDRIIRLADGTPWASVRAQAAWEIVYRLLSSGEAKSMSQLREALGCPRRIAVALLEYFDGLGLTQRNEDFRLRGMNFREEFSRI